MKKSRLIIGAAATLILIALGIYFNPWSKSPERAYAAVISKIKKTKTMTCKISTTSERTPGVKIIMEMDLFYKTPGYERMNSSIKTPTGTRTSIHITNMLENKYITISPSEKTFHETELSDSLEIYRKNHRFNYIEYIQSLPKSADEVIGQREIDGRLVKGFIVKEQNRKNTVWLDAATNELVRIDMEILTNWKDLNPQFIMTDIKFNVILDDSLFSIIPPEGYERIKSKGTLITYKPKERDFLSLLGFLSTYNKERLFPSLVKDTTDIIKHIEPVYKKLSEGNLGKKSVMGSMRLGLGFVSQMKPENDWHYKGKGVKLGTADKPICWWKPDGAEKYRVIYGDLKIRDLDPDELKKPEFNSR